jgi:hypothetical protein
VGGTTPPVPGSPAAVLSAILVGGPAYGQRARATFSTTGAPGLPSLMTEVVALPAYAELDADVAVLGALISQGWATGGVTEVTSAYTTLPTDAVILANPTAGSFPVTLADATQPGFFTGQRVTIINTGSAGTVTVTGTNGQLINGESSVSLTLATPYTGVVFGGANWWVWAGAGTGSGVTSVTATDTSIVVGGTSSAPTVATGTLDVIATDHPPAANWSNNSKKITSVANGSASTDVAAYGQLPSPSSPLATTSGGTGLATSPMTPVVAKPSDPANPTISTSLSLQGYGSSATFTPASTGVCEITAVTFAQTANAAAKVVVQGRWGTAASAPPGVEEVTISSGAGGSGPQGTIPSGSALVTVASGTAPAAGSELYITGTTQPSNFAAGTGYYVVLVTGQATGTYYLSTASGVGADAVAYGVSAGVAVQAGVVASSWGTAFGNTAAEGVKGGSALGPVCWVNFDIVTFTPGTAYALDVGISTGATADAASVSGTMFKVRELA